MVQQDQQTLSAEDDLALRKLRVSHGMSLEQLGVEMSKQGVSASISALSRIERLESIPQPRRLVAYCGALDIDPRALVEFYELRKQLPKHDSGKV